MIEDPQTNENPMLPGETGSAAERMLTLVRQLVQELQPRLWQDMSITLDSRLDSDLGFDSLTRMELLARIEKTFDVSLAEQMLAAAETPRDFLRAALSADGRIQIQTSIQTEAPLATATGPIPLQAATLVEALKHHVSVHADRPHIRLYSDVGEEETITYGRLWQGAEPIAAGLHHLGLQHGESVLIMLPTGHDYFISFIGVLLAGGVPVPVYPPGRLKQIEEHLIRHAAIAANSLAGLMISMPEAKPFAQMMRQRVESLRAVTTVQELSAAGSVPPALPTISPTDTAFLQYTSGSTGMPKGVILSHANLLANIRAMGGVLKVTPADVFVSWLPLYHDMGLIGAWLGSLYYACPLVVMSPLSFIAKPLRWLQAIHRYQGTISAAPNFAYELCLRRLEDHDIQALHLGSWRCALNGAEPVSPDTLHHFTERFSACGFHPEAMMPVYGLAESSVGLAFPACRRPPLIDLIDRDIFMKTGRAVFRAHEKSVLKIASCGQPLPGHQIRIVDQAGRELPDRQTGRLQFRGPSATSGYFRNQEQTFELYDGDWLNSGDLGYFAEGELYITGRSKDLIIRAGRNIYPAELEDAIGNIEGIRKGCVAVFGSMDTKAATEKMIVLAESRKREPDALSALRKTINAVVSNLCGAPPDEVVLAAPNTVLKTSSGKVRRSACKTLYESDTIGMPQRTVWLQVVRFSITGAIPQLRRQVLGLAAVIYAGYCWFVLSLAALPLWIFIALLPKKSWRWTCVRFGLAMAARCAFLPVRVHGLANLPPAGKPCVMVSNHASYLDGLVLAGFLPRTFSFIAKAELQENFLVRFLLERLGTQFVDRLDQQQGIADTRTLIKEAEAGRSLLFFAEGTFLRMPGLLPFKLGAFETALAGDLPVIPLAIRGTRSILRADTWFPRRGMISITIGPPLLPRKISAADHTEHWTALLKLRHDTRTWIGRHCGEPDLEYERPVLPHHGRPDM